jgi:nicotinamide-nucleotide amidase
MMDMDRIGARARDAGIRVAVAESLTCGLLASRIGRAERAGEWFAGGVVAYQTRTKQRVLGVAEGLDPVSAACAEQLAAGVHGLLEVDIAIAVTGVGGPDPQDGHDPGTVYIGWCDASGSGSRLAELAGPPEQVLEGAIAAALTELDRLVG